ncbi:MAG: hypothetical protein H7Z73_11385 [Candidatus Saccharibacteria bacterium]|nr:hypothetical protein [Moraxellaceae bacterium]
MTNLRLPTLSTKLPSQPIKTKKTKINMMLTNVMRLPSIQRLGALTITVLLTASAAHATPLELRRDAREPGFAQVMYAYYQGRPYDALTTMLANRQLAFNASGIGNTMLSNLYTQYGLPREAVAALTRAGGSDVTANNRNDPWLNFGKLLYQTGQDSLALNFLRDPPSLLSPKQESERMVMVTNLLARTDHPEDAVEALQTFQTPLRYYRKLSRYNLALALLQKKHLEKDEKLTPKDIQVQKEHELSATRILDDLMKDKMPPLKPIITPSESALASKKSNQVAEKDKVVGYDQNGWSSSYSYNKKYKPSLIESREIGNGSTFTKSALSGGDLIDDSITTRESANLNDKIALSLAYLRLIRDEPELAKTALRNVQLDSPYSNQALLTSAHIYYRLKDYPRSFNFSNELVKRNPSDPLVQEGWLMSASALEDQQDPNAADRYRAAIQIYKEETVKLSQFDGDLEKLDALKTFPVEASDPILLGLPKIPQTPLAGVWAQLLERSEILTILQQVQQTQLLQSKLADYEKQLAVLESIQVTDKEDQTDIKSVRVLLTKVKSDFQKSEAQDQKALLAQIRVSLDQKQLQIDHYLTEALLGLQRVSAERSSSTRASRK